MAAEDDRYPRDGRADLYPSRMPATLPARRLVLRDRAAAPDLDAVGLDKRRTVVGGSYAPSFAKQASIYGAFLAVVAALVIGAIVIVGALDQPRERENAAAPWAQPESEQLPPRPIDFPRNGRTEID